MRVIGVDPGSRRTGWGVIEKNGSKLTLIDTGIIHAGEKKPLIDRLSVIHTELTAIITEHRPQAMAVEEIFFAKYANAALKLGHARGVILLCAAQHTLPLSEYPPTVVKRATVGKGRASKDQVAMIIGTILGLRDLPDDDATDAMAVAITHLTAAAFPQKPPRSRTRRR